MLDLRKWALAAVVAAPVVFVGVANAQTSAREIAPGVVFNAPICAAAAGSASVAEACCDIDNVPQLNSVLAIRECGFLRRFFARFVTRRPREPEEPYRTPRGDEECETFQCDRDGGGNEGGDDGGGRSGGGQSGASGGGQTSP